MTAFFAWHRKHKKIIFSRSKTRDKNPVHIFLDFILFFNIAVQKFDKKIVWSSWNSQEFFLSPEYPPFRSKFWKFGKLTFNYFYVI